MRNIICLCILSALAGCSETEIDLSDSYTGESVSGKWDALSACQTARMLAKDRFSDSERRFVYTETCTVVKLTAPMPGKYSPFEPYAATWENGIALRIFENFYGDLVFWGFSRDGIPFSWNTNHSPTEISLEQMSSECRKIFVNKVSAQSIEVVENKKYDDNSGGNVEITYIGGGDVKTKGSCLYDREGMLMASINCCISNCMLQCQA